jgi:hypothetical protein
MWCRRKGTGVGRPLTAHPPPRRLWVWCRQLAGGAEVVALTFGGGRRTSSGLVRLGHRCRSGPVVRACHVGR